MEQAVQEGQRKLEEKRRELQTVKKPERVKVQLPEISLIEVPTGEQCNLHRLELENGDCPECKRQRELFTGQEQRRRARELEETLGSIRLGARYRECTFENYVPTCEASWKVLNRCIRYAETFAERLKSGDCLLMLGNIGNGKNHLSAAICNYIAGQGYQPLHTSAIRIIRRIRATWATKEDEQSVIDSFAKPDLLVIDEIGRQVGSKDEERLLFDVGNVRYENRKPTIIISNLDLAGVTSYLGEAMVDRLREGNGGICDFTWQSYRGKA